MNVLNSFVHNEKVYEVRCWHDDDQGEWVARGFQAGKPIEGFVYTCSDETHQDMGGDAYTEMMKRIVRDDIVCDRWAEVIRPQSR